MRGLITLMRPRQWVKNGFVLAPLFFAGEFLDLKAIGQALGATLLFCLASSAAYIVNDICDVERDRRHPKKSKTRPLAAGSVTRTQALVLLGVVYAILAGSWFVAPAVFEVVLLYLGLNFAYSFVLKHQPVVDIFSVALGFVLRVYAGGVALQVPVSSWMFITTLCLALYLAAVKRRQELNQSGAQARPALAGYTVSLVDRYAQISATGAFICYSMFVMASKPRLVFSIPLVLFGICRYWYVVDALGGGESPTDVLLADWQLLTTLGLWIALCAWALWPAWG